MLTFALLVSVALLSFSLPFLEKLMVAASDAGSGEKGGYKLCCLRRSCSPNVDRPALPNRKERRITNTPSHPIGELFDLGSLRHW